MKTLVTGPIIPNLDSFSGSVAYASYLCQIQTSNSFDAKFQDNVRNEAEYMAKIVGISPEKYLLKDSDDQYKSYILLGDSKSGTFPDRVDKSSVSERINNRQDFDFPSYPNALFQYENVACISTLIAEKYFFSQPASITNENGILLHSAICLSTGNFKSETTTFRDLRMKNWLEDEVRIDLDICKKLLSWRSDFIENFLEEVVNSELTSIKLTNGKKCKILELITLDAEVIVERADELLGYIINSKGKADEDIVLVQDAKKGKTYVICSNNTCFEYLTKNKFPGKKARSYWQVDKMILKESFLSLLNLMN